MDRLLIDYVPHVLRTVKEFKALMDTEQPEIDVLWGRLYDVLADQFVLDATGYGVARWEAILSLYPRGTDTLEQRKLAILARLNEKLPYTIRRLEQLLEVLCGADGFTVRLRHNEYTLAVVIELKVKDMLEDVGRLLHRVCPANLVILLSLHYTEHEKLGAYRHRELEPYTHRELREEVMG